MGPLRASLRLPLIFLTLLTGLAITGLLIPGSGFRRGEGHLAFRNGCTRRWSGVVCKVLGIRIHVHGAPLSRGHLAVANHISWTDIMILASLGDYVFIAKQEVAQWPLMGPIFRGVGTLFIRRGDRMDSDQLLKTMTSRLKKDIPLLLFPEATTTRGDQVRRFGSKLFDSACASGRPVQPIAIRYRAPEHVLVPFVGDATFLGHLLSLISLRQIHVDLHFLEALPPDFGADALAQITRQSILTTIRP